MSRNRMMTGLLALLAALLMSTFLGLAAYAQEEDEDDFEVEEPKDVISDEVGRAAAHGRSIVQPPPCRSPVSRHALSTQATTHHDRPDLSHTGYREQ